MTRIPGLRQIVQSSNCQAKGWDGLTYGSHNKILGRHETSTTWFNVQGRRNARWCKKRFDSKAHQISTSHLNQFYIFSTLGLGGIASQWSHGKAKLLDSKWMMTACKWHEIDWNWLIGITNGVESVACFGVVLKWFVAWSFENTAVSKMAGLCEPRISTCYSKCKIL